MSYSNCPNAVINIGKGTFATGAINYFNTAGVASQNWNYSVLNGIVTLEVIIPANAVLQAGRAVTIANALPVGLRPVTSKVTQTPALFPVNNNNADRINPLSYSISNAGVFSLDTISDPDYNDADQMSISGIIQYTLL